MMTEKQINKIPGFEHLKDYYFITDSGDIISNFANRRKTLSYSTNHKGYYLCSMSVNKGRRKTASVHRLVALAFIDNPYNKEQVNHIDGNKINNSVHNLEWVTNQENMTHSWETNLRDNSWFKGENNYQWNGDHKNCRVVVQKDLEGHTINTYKSIAIASRETGLGISGIGKTCRRETKNNHYKGYIWEFKN